jgi:hypothetical protein
MKPPSMPTELYYATTTPQEQRSNRALQGLSAIRSARPATSIETKTGAAQFTLSTGQAAAALAVLTTTCHLHEPSQLRQDLLPPLISPSHQLHICRKASDQPLHRNTRNNIQTSGADGT